MADTSQAAPTTAGENAGGSPETSESGHETEASQAPASLNDFEDDLVLSDPRVKKALDDQAAALKAKFRNNKSKPPKPQPTAQPGNDEPPPWLGEFAEQLTAKIDAQNEIIAKLQARDEANAFDRAFAKHQIGQDRDVIEALHAKERPADLETWMAKLAERWPVTQPKPGKETPTPGATPAGGQRSIESMSLTELTAEDVARLQSEGRFHDVLERHRLGGNNGRPMPFGKRPLPK